VVFFQANTICFNLSIDTLAYIMATEAAVVLNRNTITAVAIRVFIFTVRLLAFVSLYHISASLSPMLWLTFAGTTLFALPFCVGQI
jgi:hypothetical protein